MQPHDAAATAELHTQPHKKESPHKLGLPLGLPGLCAAVPLKLLVLRHEGRAHRTAGLDPGQCRIKVAC